MSHLAKQYVPPDSHSTEALSWQQSHFLRLFIYLLFKTSSWSVDKTLPVGEIDSQTALVPWPFSRSDGSMTISIITLKHLLSLYFRRFCCKDIMYQFGSASRAPHSALIVNHARGR